MRGVDNPSEWLGIILDRHSWRFKSEIEIDEVNNFRIFKIVLPLPPLVLTFPEYLFWDIRKLKCTLLLCYKLQQKSKLSDGCSSISNAQPIYLCEALTIIRLENGSTIFDGILFTKC